MPDIYINTDRPIDRSIVAGINQPQREAPIGALVAGSSYDTNLYFVRNDGTYNALSGDAGASVQVSISTIGKPKSGTFTLTDGTDTTSAIEYGASALEVQTALNALNSGTGVVINSPVVSISGVGKISILNSFGLGIGVYYATAEVKATDGEIIYATLTFPTDGSGSILVGVSQGVWTSVQLNFGFLAEVDPTGIAFGTDGTNYSPSEWRNIKIYKVTNITGFPDPDTDDLITFLKCDEASSGSLIGVTLADQGGSLYTGSTSGDGAWGVGADPANSQVTVEKVSDQQYVVAVETKAKVDAISGSNVSLYPESTPTASIAVAGSETTNAQQIVEITRQPAVYQATWSTIANGFNATLALNTTRLLQSLLIDAGLPFYIEVKLNGETVAREVVGMEYSTMPESAFSATGLATLLDTFAASPASNAAFSASTWAAALNRLSGWASYTDTTRTSGSPYVLAADTDTHFQIEASTVVDSQKPSDITTFYTGSPTYLITGRDGDNLDVMLYFKALPSTANQWLDIWVDIGGDVGEIYRQSFSFPRGLGVERGILYALPSAFTLATWEENGGKIYIRSNASLSIYDITINLDRSHKAR